MDFNIISAYPTVLMQEIRIEAVPPLLGDVNLNGSVDLVDAILLMQYVSDNVVLSAKQFKAADINRDGEINVGDVIIIMQMCIPEYWDTKH